LSKINPENLARLEARFFEDSGSLGAAVAVWQGGMELLSLVRGHRDRARTVPWTEETLVPVWSCTKGPAVAATLSALEENGRTLAELVATIWPEFAQTGKETITIGQLLSHQAGLAALDDPPSITDHQAVVRAIERQAPLWTTGHGYHPRTFGFLLEELVRRLTGAASLGDYWRESLAEPLGLDVWIGLPESEHGRVASIYPGRNGEQSAIERRFYEAFSDRASLSARAFGSPRGLHAVADMNDPAVWSVGYPAMGGLASAQGLAVFYAFLAKGGSCAGEYFFSECMIETMETTLAQGPDQVLLRETAFAAGFMKDPVGPDGLKQPHALFGPNIRAFGHPGAGGSLAFADPETGIGFAYVMNQMDRSVFPAEKTLALVSCLYSNE
jgi:CubicO group peptidase (beta-lactamase class C family)